MKRHWSIGQLSTIKIVNFANFYSLIKLLRDSNFLRGHGVCQSSHFVCISDVNVQWMREPAYEPKRRSDWPHVPPTWKNFKLLFRFRGDKIWQRIYSLNIWDWEHYWDRKQISVKKNCIRAKRYKFWRGCGCILTLISLQHEFS